MDVRRAGARLVETVGDEVNLVAESRVLVDRHVKRRKPQIVERPYRIDADIAGGARRKTAKAKVERRNAERIVVTDIDIPDLDIVRGVVGPVAVIAIERAGRTAATLNVREDVGGRRADVESGLGRARSRGEFFQEIGRIAHADVGQCIVDLAAIDADRVCQDQRLEHDAGAVLGPGALNDVERG